MKLLAIIDMQNDFIDGALGTKEAEAIVPKVCDYIKGVDGNTRIVFTRDTHSEDYLNSLEGRKLPVEHCIFKTPGWKINEDVIAAVRDKSHIICDKFTFGMDMEEWENAIYELSFWIEEGSFIDEIEIMGLCTDICVISNALILRVMYPNIPIKIISDCCAGVTPESHKNALEAMKMCQIDVI